MKLIKKKAVTSCHELNVNVGLYVILLTKIYKHEYLGAIF